MYVMNQYVESNKTKFITAVHEISSDICYKIEENPQYDAIAEAKYIQECGLLKHYIAEDYIMEPKINRISLV